MRACLINNVKFCKYALFLLVCHLLYFLDRNYRASHRPQIKEEEGFHFHHIQRRIQRQEVSGEEIPQHPGWQGT